VSFAAWAFASLRDFQRAASRNSLAKVLLCASLLWAAINLFYLGNSIYGYAADMRNPRLRALR
jgi:4-hydroxybenzoate polyprenyltransferase